MEWVLVISAVLIYLRYAIGFAHIATQKGYSGIFYLTCILTGPLEWWYVTALLDKTKSAGTEYIDEQYASFFNHDSKPAKQKESVHIHPSEIKSVGWTCTCGRNHPAYVSSCPCGVSKSQIK